VGVFENGVKENIWTEEELSDGGGGRWRKPHKEEPHNGNSAPNITIKSGKMRWTERVARMWAEKIVHAVLFEEREGKWQLGRLKRKWDNIKVDIRELAWIDMEWIDLAQDGNQWRTLVNTLMNLQVS
jgi:hypothetical protein